MGGTRLSLFSGGMAYVPAGSPGTSSRPRQWARALSQSLQGLPHQRVAWHLLDTRGSSFLNQLHYDPATGLTPRSILSDFTGLRPLILSKNIKMPRARVYKCTTCGTSHPRPTGKHCQWVDIEQSEEPEAPPTQAAELTQALLSFKAQMDTMGERMGAMEKLVTTKINTTPQAAGSEPQVPHEAATGDIPADMNVPSVSELRRDYVLGREVNRRLAEMDIADDSADAQRTGAQRPRGKRSGAARTVQDSIIHDIDWPHFHIYTPPGAEAMTFERLTVAEFTFGFLQMVDQPDAKFNRAIMWDLLKDIMEDAVEYPWANVRNFYWVVGNQVENDRMKWEETEKIAKLRVKHSQKHEVVVKKQATQQPNFEKTCFCVPYQKRECPEKNDHGGLRHICAHCVRVKAGTYPHPELDCRRKNGIELPKNVKGGE